MRKHTKLGQYFHFLSKTFKLSAVMWSHMFSLSLVFQTEYCFKVSALTFRKQKLQLKSHHMTISHFNTNLCLVIHYERLDLSFIIWICVCSLDVWTDSFSHYILELFIKHVSYILIISTTIYHSYTYFILM